MVRRLLFFLMILLILTGTTLTVSMAVSALNEAGTVRMYYAGPPGGVSEALGLAARFENYRLVDDLGEASIIVLNNTLTDAQAVRARVEQGAGLLVILGPDIGTDDLGELLGANDLILVALSDPETAEPLSLQGLDGDNPLLEAVVWESAPQIRARSVITGGGLEPLVVGFEDGALVLGNKQVGQGTVFVLTAHLTGNDVNPQIQDWAYFNYLIYYLITQGSGQTPRPFADYPGTPVPHTTERAVMFAILAGMLAIAATAFILVRRYSRANPQLLDELVTGRVAFEERQASTPWEEVGFHRPLGGFMFALMLGLVLFVPLIIYQNLVLPSFILPSAQALGIWGRVSQFFILIWQFFDMGTSAAFIKFLSEYRVRDPRRGILFGQVFVWWQALSGALQVALVVVIAGAGLPRTIYALYAWSVIVHALIQIPGFYQVMRHALMGLQRFDYAQMLDMGLNLVFPMITQPIFVTLFVLWGRGNPIFGMAMGGLLGMGVAAYASELLAFVLGLWLYRRLGYGARVLFLAHFDWATVRQAFRFGFFEMLGASLWGFGQSMEILITQTRLVNYAEIWGNWTLAQNFIFAFQVLQTLYSNLLSSISEAVSQARLKLGQYYAAMAYKWGGLISAFIGAVLLAVADRFILGATGPEFERAAILSIPLVIWGAFQYPSWVGDTVQLGANRPYLKSILIGGEQITRLVLALLLLERFQINALIIAYFIGLTLKGVAAYVINHHLCFPQRFYWWQSLGAPLLAGVAHYLILRQVTGLIWQGDQITSILIFLIGILFSFPLFAFLYGLAGGWDEDTLGELKRSTDLSSFMRPLAWLFWKSTALGAAISPLHGRFPVEIYAEAMQEAQQLTNERVEL